MRCDSGFCLTQCKQCDTDQIHPAQCSSAACRSNIWIMIMRCVTLVDSAVNLPMAHYLLCFYWLICFKLKSSFSAPQWHRLVCVSIHHGSGSRIHTVRVINAILIRDGPTVWLEPVLFPDECLILICFPFKILLLFHLPCRQRRTPWTPTLTNLRSETIKMQHWWLIQ